MTADEVMASYSAALARGDREAAFSLYADDVVLRLPGRTAFAGEHRGRQAVVATLGALLARAGDVEIETLERLSSGDRVALVLRERVRRDEVVLEIRRVNLYRVRDGQIVEIEMYEGDQYAVDAFFGAEG
jgi:ketosteroid isomerase-like protein